MELGRNSETPDEDKSKEELLLGDAILEDEKIIGAIAVNHDITARKRVEENLKESQQRLEDAQRIARLGNWEWCLEENTIKGSAEAYRIFGLMPLEAVSFDFVMGFVHQDDIKYVEKKVEQVRLSGAPLEAEFRIKLADGTIKYVHTMAEAVYRSGKAAKVQGTIQDVTERKLREEEQQRLVKELQDALARVKTLSGLLPICASCKRIRDDKGNWKSVERYVSEHSEAEFSHSICPDCEEKIYKKEME